MSAKDCPYGILLFNSLDTKSISHTFVPNILVSITSSGYYNRENSSRRYPDSKFPGMKIVEVRIKLIAFSFPSPGMFSVVIFTFVDFTSLISPTGLWIPYLQRCSFQIVLVSFCLLLSLFIRFCRHLGHAQIVPVRKAFSAILDMRNRFRPFRTCADHLRHHGRIAPINSLPLCVWPFGKPFPPS